MHTSKSHCCSVSVIGLADLGHYFQRTFGLYERFSIFLEFEYLYFVQAHNQAAQVLGLEEMYWNVLGIQSIFVNKLKPIRLRLPHMLYLSNMSISIPFLWLKVE